MDKNVAVNFAGVIATDVTSLLSAGLVNEARISVGVLVGIISTVQPDSAYSLYSDLSTVADMNSAELLDFTGSLLRFVS